MLIHHLVATIVLRDRVHKIVVGVAAQAVVHQAVVPVAEPVVGLAIVIVRASKV